MAIVLKKLLPHGLGDRRKSYTNHVTIGLVLALMLGCSTDSPRNQQLRIGTNIGLGYDSLYLADQLNYFNGEDIRLIEFSSTSQVMRAYRNGQIDGAALTLSESSLLLNQGYQPRVVLLMDHPSETVNVRADWSQTSTISVKPINSHGFLHGNLFPTLDPIKKALEPMGSASLFERAEPSTEKLKVLVIRQKFLLANENTVNLLVHGWRRAANYITEHAVNFSKAEQLNIGVEKKELNF
ncbi:MAG: ABC transporter substrate-binding protein [Pseudomonadales bacterium]|nr:ABC transporter substrate-binding protein [Pseudomonadales bacterium]